MGVKLDKNKNNNQKKGERSINDKKSKVNILVIPTDEELVIALDTMRIVKNLK